MPMGVFPWAMALAVIAGFAGLAWLAATRGSADFTILVRGGGRVEVRGDRIPQSKVGAIRSFFGRDLGLDRPLTVRGTFGPGGTVRIRFSGPLSDGQKQRARNFLVEHLR